VKRDAIETGIVSFIAVAVVFSILALFGILLLYLFKAIGISIYILTIGTLFFIFSARIGALLHASKRQQAKMYEQLFRTDEKDLWFLWGYRTGLSADIWLMRVIGLGLVAFAVCVLCGLIEPFSA
jgi:uncharacterized membrane protein YbhN (UPF0104 family)